MVEKSFTNRLVAALANTEEQPEPDLGPVGDGEKVRGRVSPAAQAIYLLEQEIRQEYEAATAKFAGGPECGISCPCMGYSYQAETLRGLFYAIANDQAGAPLATNSALRAGWTLVEVPLDERMNGFGGLGLGLLIMGLGARDEIQEV